MPVYLIVEIEVRDRELYSQYVDRVFAVVEKYGGHYLARGGEITAWSGNWNPERIILIEFENKERLQACFASSEYLALAPLRERSTLSRSIVVDGCTS